MAEQTFPQFATDALHAGQEPEQWNSRAVIPIISLATTFKQYEPGVPFSVSFTVFLMLENTCIYILSKKNRNIYKILYTEHNNLCKT